MRIKEIRHLSVPMTGNIANAVVNFSEHTISLVAVLTDQVRNGRPVYGIAFDSIGRFAQGGIINERMVPRLMRAEPESLLGEDGYFDCAKVLACLMRNEKPGGHGDRAAAAGALELAFWDANAKLRDEPAYRTIARAFGTQPVTTGNSVYAAGGYYYPQDGVGRLKEELLRYKDMGYTSYKMKIGGASLQEDIKRIEAALTVAGTGDNLSVDANGRFDLTQALAYAKAISPYALRWYEEIGDPLDYDLNRKIAESYDGPIATGENLFSLIDVKNLIRHGGMRAGKDIFQMDPALSYGLTEFAKMIAAVEAAGFDKNFICPHGGHLINLHIVTAMGLSGCEAYPGVFQPFGGYSDQCRVENGRIFPAELPGFGIEDKTELKPHIAQLLA
jgi:L-alanine-DL-glutamate epimerase and related enzymes of enolase superfamily